MNTIIKNKIGLGFMVMAFISLVLPTFASAATYGYVGNDGYVRSIVANEWQSALDIASLISMHSGVILLETTRHFEMVGDYVVGVANF